MKKRILFVDANLQEQKNLQAALAPLCPDWHLGFASSAPQALEEMTRATWDAVVTDLRMPGMDGIELLAEVKQKYPKTIRIALVGPEDKELAPRSAGLASQQLSKASDGHMLRSALARSFMLDQWLSNDSTKNIVARLNRIPSVPTLYFQMIKELKSPHASLERIGSIISQDMVMTAKMLQMVNSAFFGLKRRVSNPVEAAMFLGLDRIKSLILVAHIFSYFDRSLNVFHFSIDALWHHSVQTGNLARQIAEAESPDPQIAEEAYTAGILHDIGQLALAANLSLQYDQIVAMARREKRSIWRIERERLGSSHAEIGACLIGLWGLPATIVEAIAYHHCPSECCASVFSPLTAVHMANALQNEWRAEEHSEADRQFDIEYLARMGLQDHLEMWRSFKPS